MASFLPWVPYPLPEVDVCPLPSFRQILVSEVAKFFPRTGHQPGTGGPHHGGLGDGGGGGGGGGGGLPPGGAVRAGSGGATGPSGLGGGAPISLGQLGPCPQCGTPLTAYRRPPPGDGTSAGSSLYIECAASPACSIGR